MKRIVYLLLAVSIGFNVGLIFTRLSERSAGRPGEGPPPHGRRHPATPPVPEAVISDHVEGMTEHLGLTAEQQGAIREALRTRMPELMVLRHRAREADRLLAGSFAAPDFDPARFAELARRATSARTQVDSVSAILLMAEAKLLTAEQRRQYATVVPAVHTDPRRVAPPPRPGRQSEGEPEPR